MLWVWRGYCALGLNDFKRMVLAALIYQFEIMIAFASVREDVIAPIGIMCVEP